MRGLCWAVVTLLLCAIPLDAQSPQARWYLSNKAGMAMSRSYPLLALRGAYALSVEDATRAQIPAQSQPYCEKGWRVEKRTLYKDGKQDRTQWVFFDKQETVRAAAAFQDNGAGFVELYGKDGALFKDIQFHSSTEWTETTYTYKDDYLLSVKGQRYVQKNDADKPEVAAKWRDIYRYNRQGGLRIIDRDFDQADSDNKADNTRVPMPRIDESMTDTTPFVKPALLLDTVFLDDAAKKREKSSFSIGKDGKIQSEQVKDKDDKPVGEFVNTWDGDRLASITWTPDSSDSAATKDKGKTVKYEYDKDGNRTRELDYTGDQLEREVLFDGDKQTEKLYVNGVLMLTTVTENGKKISETRPQKPLY